MASGPDGALWFTNGGSIGKITTRGVVSVYGDESIKRSHEIAGIATGPDKAIWFTNPSGKSIGRLRIVPTR